MAVLAYPGNLQTAQTGNADSTNTIDRVASGELNLRPAILRIVSTVGATPTVTVNIRGSMDGTNFYNIPYLSLDAVGGDYSVAALTITTAATKLFLLMPFQTWRYVKLVMSANTNVTLTSDIL